MKWIQTDPDPQHWFKVYVKNVDIEDNDKETKELDNEPMASSPSVSGILETLDQVSEGLDMPSSLSSPTNSNTFLSKFIQN